MCAPVSGTVRRWRPMSALELAALTRQRKRARSACTRVKNDVSAMRPQTTVMTTPEEKTSCVSMLTVAPRPLAARRTADLEELDLASALMPVAIPTMPKAKESTRDTRRACASVADIVGKGSGCTWVKVVRDRGGGRSASGAGGGWLICTSPSVTSLTQRRVCERNGGQDKRPRPRPCDARRSSPDSLPAQ